MSSTSARCSRCSSILQKLPADAPAGSNAQKVGDYYRAFLDTAAIDQQGHRAGARRASMRSPAAKNHQDLTRLMGRPDLALERAAATVGIATDQKNPDRYAVIITQSGLGPARP